MNTTGKVVTGAVVGLAAGALLGILFAPDKGSATRKKIVDKKDDYADAIKTKYNDLTDAIKEKLGSKNGTEMVAEKTK
jgi:gas vesicle protein